MERSSKRWVLRSLTSMCTWLAELTIPVYIGSGRVSLMCRAPRPAWKRNASTVSCAVLSLGLHVLNSYAYRLHADCGYDRFESRLCVPERIGFVKRNMSSSSDTLTLLASACSVGLPSFRGVIKTSNAKIRYIRQRRSFALTETVNTLAAKPT